MDVMLIGLAFVAAAAGSIASVSGFGIGSILTPFFAASFGTKLAVALVSVPHLLGTAVRFAILREHLNRRVLISFGITSAACGLLGALLHEWLRSVALSYTLGALLVLAGLSELTGAASRLRFGRTAAWIAGGLSGLFGGLVGNQGGIRSAALFGFEVSKEEFVATSTAIALLVDIGRVPIYTANEFHEMVSAWPALAVAIVGVLAGTIIGKSLLRWIPEAVFRRIVSLLILALGIWMFIHPGS
jgi:uncharacterized protein